MTLLRDVLDIPAHVHQSDFVLRLAEGVAHPRETLADYVVTEQLRTAFDRALDLVRTAVENRRSAGAYLHGSFGSGKSHFMAVLHLLLAHDPDARSISELGTVITKLDWARDKKFLLVPYHLMGVSSLEQAILGGYVERVRALHPEAPLPALYPAEAVFGNADSLRATMGDAAFFSALNAGAEADRGWGKFATGAWNADTYATARAAPPRNDQRLGLLRDLVNRVLPALRSVAAGDGEGFVPLDQGLAEISKHAKSLGYHGLVLFLDELMLWLASHVADLEFINREASKLAKLIEAQASDRPVPIVSFIARQRDLRELVGEHLPGAEKLSFADTLRWSDGRFEKITLEDRNLPQIAAKRLLRTKGDAATALLDAAFEETLRSRPTVLDTLLGSTGDRAGFRSVYPFSPALVQTLVAISAVLQRERTALRVMLQLLVGGRERLRVGDVIPVGDLFDLVVSNDEPFSDDMRRPFELAKRLYQNKLRPILERQYGLSGEDAWRDPPPGEEPSATAIAFRADDRLMKTLLLAALVPEVEALRELTPERLSALNHGSLVAPFPGRERSLALDKVRLWNSQAGEIRIGDDAVNPLLAIQLSSVDVESLLERVKNEDNVGNRRRAVRELLYRQLGLGGGDDLLHNHQVLWRGTRRRFEVVFGNIRAMSSEDLRPSGDDWKLVLDFPFDHEGRGARDDLSRLDEFRNDHPEPTATVCWVPDFFSRQALAELGKFLLVSYLLQGDRLDTEAAHLSASDRAQARGILDSQRGQLEQVLLQSLEAAYGVRKDLGGRVDGTLELAERFQSLDARFAPQPPGTGQLKSAFESLLHQVLAYRFPRHPQFEVELTRRDLQRVLDEIRRTAQEPGGRRDIDKEARGMMRQIAQPLELGEMHEAAFVISDRWRNRLAQVIGLGSERPTVRRLRTALENLEGLPEGGGAWGLTREVQDLVLLSFAEQTNRALVAGGVAVGGEIGSLRDDCELRQEHLPDEEVWRVARERASEVFGLPAPAFRTAAAVARLAGDLQDRAKSAREDVGRLWKATDDWLKALGVPARDSARWTTARSALGLVEKLVAAPAGTVVEVFTEVPLLTSAAAVARALHTAAEVARSMPENHRTTLEGLPRITDGRRPRAEAILTEVRDALRRDELAVPFGPVISRAAREAVQVLAEGGAPAPTPRPDLEPGPRPEPPAPAGWVVVETSTGELDAADAEALFSRLSAELAVAPQRRRLRLEWTLVEKPEAEDVG